MVRKGCQFLVQGLRGKSVKMGRDDMVNERNVEEYTGRINRSEG